MTGIPSSWAQTSAVLRRELDQLDRQTDPEKRAVCLATIRQKIHMATLEEPRSLEVAFHLDDLADRHHE